VLVPIAIALVGLACVAWLRGGNDEKGPTYRERARPLVAPVLAADRELSQELEKLLPTSSTAEVRASALPQAKRAQVAVSAADRSVRALETASDERGLAASTRKALAANREWVEAVGATLAEPEKAKAAGLADLESALQRKLDGLDGVAPRGGEVVAGTSKLLAWVRARRLAGKATASEREFVSSVDAILERAEGAFEDVNDVVDRLYKAASGKPGGISASEARTSLNEVIEIRSQLVSQAGAIQTPGPGAVRVKQALVAALQASVDNNREITGCLPASDLQLTDDSFTTCLQDTKPSSDEATDAKDSFRVAWNEVRSGIGLPEQKPRF